MTQNKKSPAQTIARPVVAIVALAIVGLLVMSYWSGYRSDKGSGAEAEAETTATAEATGSAEATAAPAEGEAAAAPAASNGTVIVLIDGLNFRTGPSKSGDLIRGLDEGEKLAYVGTEDGWYKVTTAEGETGYVSASSQYTKLEQ